ncbi:tetratricopeptide repeat protein [Alteromonas pelagimontana]|uniref:Tetratricopeptide repeat protein n=1 Tax=Alteromonas pelagimontana TaxID=1858656 RepID=A0A6M4M9W4_9ALTE|nr:tetratricopeptide repeat protein [Alteromonas pelagimontana]QJR79944.1 tetratricopeptide repeat protein [Alteromonas pelagimontana]
MMKRQFKMSALALVVGVGSFLSVPVALAQSSAPVVCPGYEKGKTTLVGERAGKKVQKAFEAYNEDRVDEALQILMDVDTSDEFDKAYVGRFIGNLMAAKEGQGAKAMEYLRDAVEPKVLNDTEHSQTLKLLGDLSMQEQNYPEAIKWYNSWMDFTCKEDADVYTRMAQAYFEMKELDKIIEPADKAIALYEKPNKNPYVLKLQSYYERKMYPETVKVAETLVNTFPENKTWWTQLGLFYMLVEDYKNALATMELAYNQGYLEKDTQIKTLAQLYATNGIPYKAGQLLEKHMKSGLLKKDEEMLANVANTFHQAKNYKIAANYYGMAAKESSDPEHYQKQGTLLLVTEDYKGAIAALNQALERGAEDPAKIHFSLMEANFYAGNYKSAWKHVQEAKKDNSVRRNAVAWEPYIKEKAKNRGIDI